MEPWTRNKKIIDYSFKRAAARHSRSGTGAHDVIFLHPRRIRESNFSAP